MKEANNINLSELEDRLTSAGIDTSLWGKGKAKTIGHLAKEIASGETVLAEEADGKPIRRLEVATANIHHSTADGKLLRLKEAKQCFHDGRERQRNLAHALSEKIQPAEDPTLAIQRGIREELGISGEISLQKLGVDQEEMFSPSFPGLLTQYFFHRYLAVLDSEQYVAAGYVEEQPDKNTYFVWEEKVL